MLRFRYVFYGNRFAVALKSERTVGIKEKYKNAPGSEKLGIIDEFLYHGFAAYCTHGFSENDEIPLKMYLIFSCPASIRYLQGILI